jgi:ABC-2 type transport system permease protein
MSAIWLIVRRELGAYFDGMWGWSVIAAVLAVQGLLFNAFALGAKAKTSTDVLQDFFYFSFGVTVIAAVLLTMRLVAEERQQGTLVLLDASPLSEWQIVLGKWLSANVVLGLVFVLGLTMPALIFVNGKVSLGHVAAGYAGLLLVGAATTAIGTLGSALARSQLVAAMISSSILLVLLLGWLLARISDPPLSDLFSYLAFFDRHFVPFRKGRIATEDVVYYGSVTIVALTAATRVLAARRWR